MYYCLYTRSNRFTVTLLQRALVLITWVLFQLLHTYIQPTTEICLPLELSYWQLASYHCVAYSYLTSSTWLCLPSCSSWWWSFTASLWQTFSWSSQGLNQRQSRHFDNAVSFMPTTSLSCSNWSARSPYSQVETNSYRVVKYCSVDSPAS